MCIIPSLQLNDLRHKICDANASDMSAITDSLIPLWPSFCSHWSQKVTI